MKRLILTTLLLIFIFSLSRLSYAEERYIWLHSSDDTTYSLEPSSIHVYIEQKNIIIDLWIKEDFTQDKVKSLVAFVKQRKEYDPNLSKKLENLAYITSHQQLSIKSFEHQDIERYYYDKNGKLLYINDYQYGWIKLIPKSNEEIYFTKALEYINKNKEKYFPQKL